MALALYRKYRPASFAEVVGQEHVTDPLRIALSAGRVNHAYLFSGPRGCGKTSSARILARSLNCVRGPTPDPCGECNSCQALAPEGSGSVDVVELDAASHGGVDDARELRDRAFYAPVESRYRVFIVDEAHMVTTQGFNALLKIVEEPPEHLVFVFATTEPEKVLSTIRSRTHHYPFRLIPPGTLRCLLEGICRDESVRVEPAVYPLVIRAGGGSARDSLSVMDQLLAGAGPEGVTYDRAIALLGVTDVALIDDMVDALAAGDGAAVYGTVDRLIEAGHDPRRFAADLLDRLRDLVLLHAVPDAPARGLVDPPGDELARMQRQAERLGAATLSRFAEIVHTGLTDMRGATAPRLLLELLCARMMLPAATESDAGMLQRLERLERRVTVSGGADAGDGGPLAFHRPSQRQVPPAVAAPVAPVDAVPTPNPTPAQPAPVRASVPSPEPEAAAPAPPEPAGSPTRQAPAAAGTLAVADPAAADGGLAPSPVTQEPSTSGPGVMDAAGVRRVWSELLAAVRRTSRSTEAMLTNATVQSVEGNSVVLAHTSPPLARRLAEVRNVDVIAEALHEVLGGGWQVRCVHAEAAAQAVAAPVKRRASPPTRASQANRPPAAPNVEAVRGKDDAPPGPVVDEVPLPPEPEPEETTPPPEPMDEEAMLSEAAHPSGEVDHRDPEHVALSLLEAELGATKIDK